MNTAVVKQEQRIHTRRSCDRCISQVDGFNYPVEDWSMGGMRVFGDFRAHQMGQEVPVTMKFKLRDQILNIKHSGVIVRKAADNIGIAFRPMTQAVKAQLQQVVDDYNAREFANSQV